MQEKTERQRFRHVGIRKKADDEMMTGGGGEAMEVAAEGQR